MKDKKPLDWIPLYIDKHLFGSTRIELEPDERSVWIDLLALAGKDSGHIRANEGVPYLTSQLAGLLVIPEELLIRTIEKCIKHNKLKKLEDGTIYVSSWNEYSLSPRHKRRFEIVSSLGDTMSPNKDTLKKSADTIERDIEIEKEENTTKQKQKIIFDFNNKKWKNVIVEDKNQWSEAYPACDVELELRQMREWLLSNPDKRKKNYRRFITNWLARSQERGGTKGIAKKSKRQEEISNLLEKAQKDLVLHPSQDRLLAWLRRLPKEWHSELQKYEYYWEAKNEWEKQQKRKKT